MFTTKELEKQILFQLAQLRAEHEHEASEFLQNIRKNKDFDETYLQIKELEFKIAQADFLGKDTQELKKSLTKNKTKIRNLMKTLGVCEKDFQVKYSCAVCQDTGFVNGKKCNCLRTRINQRILNECGLELSSLKSFDDFSLDIATSPEHKKSLKQLKDALYDFSTKYPNTKKRSIFISGPTGVGKTFAVECAMNEFLKRGYTATFLTAFQMNEQFLKYHTGFDENKQSHLAIMLDPDLLVIDDLGTEPILNNVTIEYLYLVLSERMLRLKPTIVSSNLSMKNVFERYHERVFSRLIDKSKTMSIQIYGSDIRIQKKEK